MARIRHPPEVDINLLETKKLPKKSQPWDDNLLPIDILLLTVMDCEFLSCLSYLNPGFKKTYHPNLGYVYFGDIGDDEAMNLKIALMKCNEGAAGGSVVAVKNAVVAFRPKAVFSVGYCGSLNGGIAKLGDVIVSAKLITNAPTKVTENGIQECGLSVPLKKHLANLVRNAGEGWEAPLKPDSRRELDVTIHRDGVFLSGPENVQNQDRCAQLIQRFPEAVAIEMGGEGLYAAAHDLEIEWIIIKAISEYANGNNSEKESWRRFASVIAASLTADILSDPIVFQTWPHYEDCNMAQEIAAINGAVMLVNRAGETWGAMNDLLHSGNGRHNLLVADKAEPGDILLHEEQKRPGYIMLDQVSHVYEYNGDKLITDVVARDNWHDDTGGDPEIISGGPGYKHVKVKVTSQFMRGFNHTVYVYGKK